LPTERRRQASSSSDSPTPNREVLVAVEDRSVAGKVEVTLVDDIESGLVFDGHASDGHI
jgi:hypothetical protein